MDQAQPTLPENRKKNKKENRFLKASVSLIRKEKALIAAFAIPFLFLCVCFALEGCYPFGDEQILNYDAWHQYYPFWMRLYDHLHSGASLLYDPGMGMGTNFLSLLSYYGASPLNLVLVFAATRELRLLFTFLTAFRIGLAGLFCGIFLKKVFRKNDFSVPFFAACYALCGYMMGYYWNIMWLDSIALLPLAALGLIALFREGKYRLYVASLFLLLFCSYYIGFMCCLFLVLAFFALTVLDLPHFSDWLRKLLRFALFSLLGGGLAMILLLPAFYGLLNTYSVSSGGPSGFVLYESFLNLFAGLADFHEPTYIDGLPNVYTGALIAFFANAMLWAKKIRFREKLVGLFGLVFFYFSLNFNVLDYIWHGFHFTNMIPFRFSFLFSFVLVVMAYRYFTAAADRVDWVDLLGMFFFLILLVFASYWLYSDLTVLGTAGILCVAVMLCVAFGRGLLKARAFRTAVCILLCVEMASSAYIGVKTVGTTSYSGYFEGETGAEVQRLADEVREKENGAFYRMETTEWRSLNDSCFYNYPGVSQFASSANVRVSRFTQNLGLAADPGSNRFVYVHTTPLNNTLLGIKYLVAKNGYLSDVDVTKLSENFSAACALYEYQGFLGLGFMMDPAAADFRFSVGEKAYEKQNKLFRAVTGVQEDYLQVLDMTNVAHANLNVDRYDLGEYRFQVLDPNEDATYLKYNYTMPTAGMVYVFADLPEANYIQVNNAWHNIQEYANFFSAGYFREGETFTLRANIDEALYSEGSVKLYVCVLQESVWQEGLARLADETFEITRYEDTRIEGTVTAREDGYFYTSVPMENKGWTVRVDGEIAEIVPFADAMVGVRLTAGEHTVTMTYSPEGFRAGCLITLGCLAVLTAIVLFTRKKEFRFFWRESERPASPADKAPAPAEEATPAEEAAPPESAPEPPPENVNKL